MSGSIFRKMRSVQVVKGNGSPTTELRCRLPMTVARPIGSRAGSGLFLQSFLPSSAQLHVGEILFDPLNKHHDTIVAGILCGNEQTVTGSSEIPICKEPNYLCLTISLLAAVVLTTSAGTEISLATAGVLVAALTFIATARFVIKSKRQLFLSGLLALTALLPFLWLVSQPQEHFPDLIKGLYVLNLAIWLLFTSYITIIVFRSIMSAKRIRTNEIYGAIYVYLLIGIIFAEIFQFWLAWNPAAIYFDPGRFPEPLVIRNNSLLTRSTGDLLYYSFVTLGTVGYGDVTPASPAARSLSLIEAVIGIMYVATMIARFVSIQTNAEGRSFQPEHADAGRTGGIDPGLKESTDEKLE
jgi:hypothetical protein